MMYGKIEDVNSEMHDSMPISMNHFKKEGNIEKLDCQVKTPTWKMSKNF